MSTEFTDSLDLIAVVTGHHPMCVHLVGKSLASVLTERGDDVNDSQFLDILSRVLTDTDICAGDALAAQFADVLFGGGTE
jgi:hypothetical protein